MSLADVEAADALLAEATQAYFEACAQRDAVQRAVAEADAVLTTRRAAYNLAFEQFERAFEALTPAEIERYYDNPAPK